MEKKQFVKSSLAAAIFAPLCSFLPGIGSSHAATFGSEIFEQDRKGFLFMVGAVNTIIMGLSYITVYSISKSRTGTAAAVQSLLGNISSSNLTIIILTIIVTSALAFLLALNVSKLFVKFMNKINYKYLTIAIVLIVIIVNIIFTNWLGMIVLIAATSLGVFTIASSSRRINLMAALILPAIVYYLIN